MIIRGDARHIPLRDRTVQCVVTSPPYFQLRDYQCGPAQLGLEATPEQYVGALVEVFREVRRVLRDDGVLWLVLGDSFNAGVRTGHGSVRPDAPRLKRRDLIGIPWRVVLALQADGWHLRADVIWSKLNAMPESVADRPTRSHEYVFLLSKRRRYYYDAAGIAERAVSDHPSLNRRLVQRHRPTTGHRGTSTCWNDVGGWRNRRDVWQFASEPTRDAHYATFPTALASLCILASSRPGDLVLDPFLGSGTTGAAAERLGRHWAGIELAAEYVTLAGRRTAQTGLRFKSPSGAQRPFLQPAQRAARYLV